MLLDEMLALALPKDLIVVLIGTLPIFELRGALPVAIGYGFSWYYALFLSILGNMLPVPFLLLFWNGLSRLLSRVSFFQRPLNWVFERTRLQSATIGKYKFWGLLVFVAVPLPFTGAWTASLVAIVLGMKFWLAFFSIFGGVIVAGLIVLAILMGFSIAFLTMGWIGVGIVALLLAAVTVWIFLRNRNHSTKNQPVREKAKS
jgi:uncharacterized membrane protein